MSDGYTLSEILSELSKKDRFPNENIYVTEYCATRFPRHKREDETFERYNKLYPYAQYHVWNMNDYGVHCPNWDTFWDEDEYDQIFVIPPCPLKPDHWDIDRERSMSFHAYGNPRPMFIKGFVNTYKADHVPGSSYILV